MTRVASRIATEPNQGLRIALYDRTCVVRRGGLTPAWALGALLYRARGWLDAAYGVASWAEALAHITAQREPIRELQYWGHGVWGGARIGDELLDAAALGAAHRHRARLEAVRDRLATGALVWFRTCSTLGAARGRAFAERLADFLGARVAGHTFVIGFHQSGLRAVAPGARASWSATEGIAAGSADQPRRGAWSSPSQPRTITCLHDAVPAAWL